MSRTGPLPLPLTFLALDLVLFGLYILAPPTWEALIVLLSCLSSASIFGVSIPPGHLLGGGIVTGHTVYTPLECWFP